MYSKTCLKRPLKKKTKIGFQDRLLLNAGQKYCRMFQREHSAILLTFNIKLPFAIKTFILSCFEWPLKTGFTVPFSYVFFPVYTYLSSQPRSNAPHTPRIVLLGATGSGKGVQASLLANKYNIVNGKNQVISYLYIPLKICSARSSYPIWSVFAKGPCYFLFI